MPEVKAEATEQDIRAGLAEREEALENALIIFRSEIARDLFAPATGKFREAINLSRAWTEFRSRVVRAGAEEAKSLLPRNWRVAEALLAETRGVKSEYSVPAELWERVRSARLEDVISGALAAVEKTEASSGLEKAKEQLQGFIVAYPADARLQSHLRELNERLKPAVVPVKAEVAKTAEEEPVTVSSGEEPDGEEADAEASADGQRLKIAVSSTAWDRLMTVGTLVATAAMLTMSGGLIWWHYSHPPVSTKRTAKTAASSAAKAVHTPSAVKRTLAPPPAAAPVAPDEEVWRRIQSSQDPADMETFLSSFPTSPHVLRARVKLGALRWQSVDKTDPAALRAYLDAYQSGGYATQARALLTTAAEGDEWQKLDHADAKELASFLKVHPGGPHAQAARDELAALQNNQPPD